MKECSLVWQEHLVGSGEQSQNYKKKKTNRKKVNAPLVLVDRRSKMKSELENMVEEDMIAAGYNPELWADVVEYWNERLR